MPNRWCENPGLLAAARGGGLISDGPSIELQGSLETYLKFAFAPSSSGGEELEPRFGTYALMPRYEGWCESAQAPCWKWIMVGRVAAAEVEPPSRTLECSNLTVTRLSSGQSNELGRPRITIVDRTGLIESCIASFGPPEQAGVLDAEPATKHKRPRHHVDGRGCDAWDFEFGTADGGYFLEGKAVPLLCDGVSPIRPQMLITMAQPVLAELVSVNVDDVPGVVPTPTPPPDVAVIPCSTDGAGATVLDETGFFDGCTTTEPSGDAIAPATIGVYEFFDIRVTALRVLWRGSSCDDSPDFTFR